MKSFFLIRFNELFTEERFVEIITYEAYICWVTGNSLCIPKAIDPIKKIKFIGIRPGEKIHEINLGLCKGLLHCLCA